MGGILLRTKWLATLLLSLLLMGTNSVSAATRSITLDSTFAKCNVTVNPDWIETNSLESVNIGERLNFLYMFKGLQDVSTISVQLPEGDRIAQFKLGDNVDFFMPDSNIVLSVKNPVYEITYDSTYSDNFTDYNNPISAEAGTIVNVMFRGGITPGGRWEMAEDQWYLLDDVMVNDSIASFVMPYGKTIVSAAQMTNLYIGTAILCEGGTVRHPEYANAGDTILFNVYPDEGYYIKEIFVPGLKNFETLDDTTYRFVMKPDNYAWINVCFEKVPTYHSISVDSTFAKYNITVNPYWLRNSKGLDSILVGEQLDFMYMFRGLNYESTVSVREKNGGLIYKHMMGDSVDFFMPDSNIVLSVENPVYEITYDSAYINHFNGFSYPISAEAGTTVKILYEGDIIARVSRETWNGSWTMMDETTIGWEGSNTWSVTFTMPFANVLVGAAQTKNLPIYKQINCGEGQINCPQEVGNARDTIWFTVHPDAGYTIQSVNVTGGRQFQAWDDTTYMFEMVEDKSATIYACFTPISRSNSIIVDPSCKDYMKEYGSIYLTAEGYSHGYRINTQSTIDSVLKGVKVTLAHFKDLSQKNLVKVRTESGKTVEYETVTEFDSIWFFMPNENIYISMEEAATKVNIDTIVICGKGWISASTSGNAKDTIWFSVHPAVGYHVQSVEVSGNTPIHLWDDTTYIFKLVAGKDVQITVCFAIDMICGCTDPAALNYDSLATVRDNSCIYATVIYGCTDPKALNYDPEATHNSGLCEYVKEIGGCTDANALNYDSLATYNDGSCQYPREIIHGCTDTFALNYNPYAEIDNNTCEYRTVSDTIVGCMDAKAINYNPLASVSSECIYEKVDSVIVVEGCTDPKAANYNEKATKEDGSCVYANPISTYNDVAEVIVNDNQEVVVVVDTVKSIGVVETNGCEIDFAEKIDSVSVKVLSYDDNELITNWEVYQAGSVIYYDNVTVTCTEKEFVVLNLSLICNKNMKKPSGLRAKSTKVYAATLRSLVDLRDFGTTTIVLDENVASLYVYPNPASEIIYVEAPSLKDKTLQMVNLNGEVVKVVKANSNKLQIAVGDLTAGAYILFSQDGSVSETVIIK